MVWSQYIEEANITEHVMDWIEEDPDDIPSRNHPLEFQDWITWYSDDLMNMWLSIKHYREDSGNQRNILDKMSWNDFCEFCYTFSCKLPSV